MDVVMSNNQEIEAPESQVQDQYHIDYLMPLSLLNQTVPKI